MNTLTEIAHIEKQDTISDTLSKMYDLGVEHCIHTVQNFLSEVPGLAEPLVKKLEALKKP